MTTSRLFAVTTTERRKGSTDLVTTDPTLCAACGSALREVQAEEPVLFRHGGYGATRLTRIGQCVNTECRWSIEREVSEVRP